MLYMATFVYMYISLTVTFYIAGDFFLLLEQFLLQPFLQPREIECVICGGLGGFLDLPGISLLFYTTRS